MKSLARIFMSLGAGALVLSLAAAPNSAFAAASINSCRVLSAPGSYVLTADIINPVIPSSAYCIQATADRVTLDLGGRTIQSSGTRGVAIRGANSFAVRNGTIKGFDQAVLTGGHATIENLVIDGSNRGLYVFHGRIQGNTIVNVKDGIMFFGPTIATDNFVRTATNATNGMLGSPNIDNGASIVLRNAILGGSGALRGVRLLADGGLIANNIVRNFIQESLRANCPSLIVGNMLAASALGSGQCNSVDNVLQ
ncbi:MAG: hypothetical protein L0Y57_15110 [Beijerinckiaceae bacterium]|nr:hypothetical protein [Beijerinckiaceae bacterium]